MEPPEIRCEKLCSLETQWDYFCVSCQINQLTVVKVNDCRTTFCRNSPTIETSLIEFDEDWTRTDTSSELLSRFQLS